MQLVNATTVHGEMIPHCTYQARASAWENIIPGLPSSVHAAALLEAG